MTEDTERRALELISTLMRWQMRGALDWEASPTTLTHSMGEISWSTKPRIGGPVTITHRTYRIFPAEVSELAEIAESLVECGKDVQRNSAERAEYEQEMRRLAKTLLRRKAASGIRLVGVVSEPIHTDYYQDIGLEVTFAWGDGSWGNQATLEIGNEEDLRREFEDMLNRQPPTSLRRAA